MARGREADGLFMPCVRVDEHGCQWFVGASLLEVTRRLNGLWGLSWSDRTDNIPCDIIGGDSLGQMRPSLHYDACPRALLSSPLLYSVIWPWRAAEGSILPEL